MKNIIATLLLTIIPTLALATTDHDIITQVYPGEETYKTRLGSREVNRAELYHTLAEKKSAGLAEKIVERIGISGLVELEAALETMKHSDGTTNTSHDLTLATAQLGFEAEVSEFFSSDLLFLFEEGEGPSIDEAAVNLTTNVLLGRVGLQYLPFGVFNSHFISNPLTLELGEIRETALLAGYNQELFAFSIFIFNGEARKSGQDDLSLDWGFSLTLAPTEHLELGVSYLSDLADTDAGLLTADYQARIGGWSAYTILDLGVIEISGEVLGTAGTFDAADLDEDGNGSGDAPRAWNLELAWLAADNLELAARYEGSGEFAGQPRRQYGVSSSWSPRKGVSLSLEYLHGEFGRHFADIQSDDVGNRADDRDLFTFQLAFEF